MESAKRSGNHVGRVEVAPVDRDEVALEHVENLGRLGQELRNDLVCQRGLLGDSLQRRRHPYREAGEPCRDRIAAVYSPMDTRDLGRVRPGGPERWSANLVTQGHDAPGRLTRLRQGAGLQRPVAEDRPSGLSDKSTLRPARARRSWTPGRPWEMVVGSAEERWAAGTELAGTVRNFAPELLGE